LAAGDEEVLPAEAEEGSEAARKVEADGSEAGG
jgi:hypothetical protein